MDNKSLCFGNLINLKAFFLTEGRYEDFGHLSAKG